MRSVVLATGLMVLMAGLLMAKGVREHWLQQSVVIRKMEAEIQDLARVKALMEKLPRQEPLALGQAYAGFVREVGVMARGHDVAWGVTVKGMKDADVAKSALPSGITGIRELALQVTFSNLSRTGTFLSLLDMLSGIGDMWPVITRKIVCEKDSLVLEVSVLGP